MEFFGVSSIETILSEAQNYCLRYVVTQSECEWGKINPLNAYTIVRRLRYDHYLHLNKSGTNGFPDYNYELFWNWVDKDLWAIDKGDGKLFTQLPAIFRKYGIDLQLMPSIPNSIFGGVEWIDNRPVIIITDRRKDIVSAWWTLLKCVYQILNGSKENKLFASIGKFPSDNEEEHLSDEYAFSHLFMYRGKELCDRIRNKSKELTEKAIPVTTDSLNLEKIMKDYDGEVSKSSIVFCMRRILGYSKAFKATCQLSFSPLSPLSVPPADTIGYENQDEKFLNKLSSLMKMAGISQKTLANELGVSRNYISMILSGKKKLSKTRKDQISEIFNIDLVNKENNYDFNSRIKQHSDSLCSIIQPDGRLDMEQTAWEQYFRHKKGTDKKVNQSLPDS